MKRPVEKKQRPGRKKINKTDSSIAKSQAGSQKAYLRRSRRMHEQYPHSSKIGAGDQIARRNLSMGTIHRRNHRTAEMIGQRT